VPYLLSPTHEEEITSLVARTVRSYKDLPLRLYQITPKYRDEARPRHGLLRGREFVMKDLYSFDITLEDALVTYDSVRAAYSNIFAEMKLPVLAAKASSGDMGGNLSHEYHLPSSLGEDHVASCDSCDYAINEEIAATLKPLEAWSGDDVSVWRGITKDRKTLVNVWYPKTTTVSSSGEVRNYTESDINITAVKSVVPDLDASVERVPILWSAATSGPSAKASQLLNLVDSRLPPSFKETITTNCPVDAMWPSQVSTADRSAVSILLHEAGDKTLNFLRIHSGDHCPECSSGKLRVEKAIELGHTFYLGTRYSEPLGARVVLPTSAHTLSRNATTRSSDGDSLPRDVPLQMGCYGIGISRIIAAVAEHLADERGLKWPVAIAPYASVVIPGPGVDDEDAVQVYHELRQNCHVLNGQLDLVIDDRKKTLPWKLKDADLIGFPIILILGREWRLTKKVEVQIRALKIKEVVDFEVLPKYISRIYNKL